MCPAGVLVQAHQQTRLAEQFQVIREGHRVACVLQVAQHLGVREDLARVGAAKLERLLKQRRLVDARHHQDVLLDAGADEAVQHVIAPFRFLLAD